MTPEELADEVAAFVAECEERVLGVGAQQYYRPGHPQKFETMTLDGLLDYTEEELRDLVVYAVMFRIRVRRLRDAYANMLGIVLHDVFSKADQLPAKPPP